MRIGAVPSGSTTTLVSVNVRSIFPVVEKVNDEPTVDLLTQRMQVHEKTAWMLRSLLED